MSSRQNDECAEINVGHRRSRYGEMEYLRTRPGFDVHLTTPHEMPAIAELCSAYFPGLAVNWSLVWKIHHSCQCILSVVDTKSHRVAGAIAFLPLDDTGLAHLLADSLVPSAPAFSFLARPGQQAAAIYCWALCIPGRVVGAAGQIMDWWRQPGYATSDIYACAATGSGLRFMQRIGFALTGQTLCRNPLWVYHRPTSVNAA